MTPAPGQSIAFNIAATMVLAGNRAADLNLARIAHHQGIDEAELRAAFEAAERECVE